MEEHGDIEVGFHDPRTCPNCRAQRAFDKLSEGDIFAVEWFNRNVTSFTMESGMVSNLVEELGLNGNAKELFLLKLNIIYQSIRESQYEEMKNGRR